MESTPFKFKRTGNGENRDSWEGKGWTHVDELLDFRLPQVAADLGGQQHARRCHQLPVLLVEAALQHQLLKVNKGHRGGDRLQAELLAHGVHLPLQAVQGGRGEEKGGVGGEGQGVLVTGQTWNTFINPTLGNLQITATVVQGKMIKTRYIYTNSQV